MKNLCFLHHSW